jgi:hypothetical protein
MVVIFPDPPSMFCEVCVMHPAKCLKAVD